MTIACIDSRRSRSNSPRPPSEMRGTCVVGRFDDVFGYCKAV